jgi:adenosine deaminase
MTDTSPSPSSPSLDPLANIAGDPVVAALPKADIHLHQEWSPRLDRVLSRRAGQRSYDWREWAEQLMARTPPGMPRLARLSRVFPATAEADADPENFVARIEDLLAEGAADGALLIEMRFGGETALQHPDFMALFAEAERRVRRAYPRFHASALYTLLLWYDDVQLEPVLAACERAADKGLAGIDLQYQPYDAEADWRPIYRIAARMADAGLGVTTHVGEFSAANIAAALQTPGLTRLGHAVYAASDPSLLDAVAESGVTVESSLSCNVVLGAVSAHAEHPLIQFIERGIPVALCTDNPVQMCTTIGREYAMARALGLSPEQLLACTTNAIRASFLPPELKECLLEEVARHRIEEPGM